jgi:hypothetical protein
MSSLVLRSKLACSLGENCGDICGAGGREETASAGGSAAGSVEDLCGGGAGFDCNLEGEGGVVDEDTGAGGGVPGSVGGAAIVSGAVFIGRAVSADAGAGVPATGGAACTFLRAHPADANDMAQAASTATVRASELNELGIYGSFSAKGRPKSRTFPTGDSTARASGNSKRKVVPRPTSDSNSI